MTDTEEVVLTAISRGRLIFPQRTELEALRKEDELTSAEQDRMSLLSGIEKKLEIKDQWFHSALASGDWTAAGKAAEDALRVIEDAGPG